MDVSALFAAIDRRDAEGFGAFIAPSGIFRMGSYAPVVGPEASTEFVRGFFDSLDSVSHVVEKTFSADGNLFIEGRVTYGLKNGVEVTVPFLNRLKVENGLAAEYFIFLDPSPVAAALA